MKHAEVGRQCRTFMKMAEDAQLSWKELGLSQQEYMAVQGTIELGKAVSPSSIFMVVDLPAPLGPRKP